MRNFAARTSYGEDVPIAEDVEPVGNEAAELQQVSVVRWAIQDDGGNRPLLSPTSSSTNVMP